VSDEKHAVLSPSGADGWTVCAGKAAMEWGMPRTSNKYADEGTAAHQVAAWCLTEEQGAAAYIGRRIDFKTHTVEVTDDMAADVQIYVDNVRQYADGHTLMVEQKVPIGHITHEEGAEGTSDVIIITADNQELQVHDLKFGKGVQVVAENNKQMMIYAGGALEKYAALGDFKRIRLVIHQPRVDWKPKEWDISVDELEQFLLYVNERADVAWQVIDARQRGEVITDYLTPGDKQCRWCKAAATCPALAQHVINTVSDDFIDLTNETQVKEALMAPTLIVQSADNAKLGLFFPQLDLIETWCNAVRAKIEVELLAGRAVPGLKLVQGKKGNRAWSDEAAVETLFKKTFRLKNEDMYSFKLITPPVAEKLIKDKPKWWEKVKGLITQAEGKPHVTLESDPKPAILIGDPGDDFKDESVESLV
jgi:hypothetical protein